MIHSKFGESLLLRYILPSVFHLTIKMYKTIILTVAFRWLRNLVFYHDDKIWIEVPEKSAEREDVEGEWRKLLNLMRNFIKSYLSRNVIKETN
jgi:hypothetical protein